MRVSVMLVLVGCGRVSFDAPRDGGPLGHDEDGDGLPDVDDPCPHVADSHRDRDGDGIGDDCDPEPDIGRQHLLLFSTMRDGDLGPLGFAGTGTWTQVDDAMAFDGVEDGEIVLDRDLYALRASIGFTIDSVDTSNEQHQLALGMLPFAAAGPARYFPELNDVAPESFASITFFDGSNYARVVEAALPNRVHTGDVVLQYTADDVSKLVALDGGWIGEPYHLEAATQYAGGDQLRLTVNRIVLRARYAWIITSE